MLNKKPNLFFALLLGTLILSAISITSCNNDSASKPAETTVKEDKDTTQRPIVPGNTPSTGVKDTTQRPIVPGN